MSRKFLFLLFAVLLLAPSIVSVAQPSGLPVDLPREDVFVADQIYRFGAIGNYNLWVPGTETPHQHSLMYETLWNRDQETAERLYGAAASDPQYNEDFTQMTVELRDNIYWSDGVQFTADDLVFTVETLMANSTMSWSAVLNQFVDSVEKVDDFTVMFNLKEANSRFHYNFETRWNGVYMMPKHIWETVEDPTTFTFNPPVTLGAYTLSEFDANGFWTLYERREDWDRTPVGITVGQPGPQYVLTIFYGDSARKAIAMSRGELDVAFDFDYEAFQSVLETTPTARSWYTDFPWAYPNEVDSRFFAFNYETQPLFQNKDVRWALALSLNMVELQTEYIGGVARVTALPEPATSALMNLYHNPMEEWLQNLQIEIEPGTMYNPYDATIPDQIAAWAAEEGYEISGDARSVFGSGWWKFDTDAAERLLIKNGFSRDGGGNWLTPDGELWSFEVMAAPDEPDAFRMATAAADMWGDFGIDIEIAGVERSVYNQRLPVGDFDVVVPWGIWNISNVNGDKWQELRSLDSAYFVPTGERADNLGGNNIMRLQDPEIDGIIAALAAADPQSDEAIELGQQFMQLWVENMYAIDAISFKKFVTWDERYWTGFPTSENPTYMPLYWFQGGKFAYASLTPVGS